MKWDVFRIMTAKRAGNVDYLGKVESATKEGAEDCAKLMFDHSEHEKIEVEESVYQIRHKFATSYRLSDEVLDMLAILATSLGLSKASVLEMLIRERVGRDKMAESREPKRKSK